MNPPILFNNPLSTRPVSITVSMTYQDVTYRDNPSEKFQKANPFPPIPLPDIFLTIFKLGSFTFIKGNRFVGQEPPASSSAGSCHCLVWHSQNAFCQKIILGMSIMYRASIYQLRLRLLLQILRQPKLLRTRFQHFPQPAFRIPLLTRPSRRILHIPVIVTSPPDALPIRTTARQSIPHATPNNRSNIVPPVSDLFSEVPAPSAR